MDWFLAGLEPVDYLGIARAGCCDVASSPEMEVLP